MDPDALRRSRVADRIRAERLIAVLRGLEPEAVGRIVGELAGDGVRIFEVTMDRADAPLAVAAARKALGGPDGTVTDCLIGAGTVRSADQLTAARDAGVAFGVSPVLDLPVLAAALAADLPFVPGAYTPTEVDAAWRAGATFVKLFPASSLGPAHLRELRGPLGEIELIPTGGIDAGNAAAYLEAGAVAVGIGSALVRADTAGRRRIVDAVRGAP